MDQHTRSQEIDKILQKEREKLRRQVSNSIVSKHIFCYLMVKDQYDYSKYMI